MNAKKILIVSDLDGTYVDRASRAVPRNLAAIDRLKAAGGYFTLATGRYEKTLHDLIGDFASLINAPAILTNGAYLFDPVTGQRLHRQYLDGERVYALLKEIHALYPANRIRYTDDEGVHYVFEGSEPDHFRWYKVVFEGSTAEITGIRAALTARVGENGFACSYSSPFLFEILRPGATKGALLGRLREYFADRGEEVFLYAAGDYENDIDMLRHADCPVCPCNAHPDVLRFVRERGGLVTGDNDHGVIADIIEHEGI